MLNKNKLKRFFERKERSKKCLCPELRALAKGYPCKKLTIEERILLSEKE